MVLPLPKEFGQDSEGSAGDMIKDSMMAVQLKMVLRQVAAMLRPTGLQQDRQFLHAALMQCVHATLQV